MDTVTCSVNSYAVVHAGCPIEFRVRGGDELEVEFGGGPRPLVILFDAETIGLFLERGVLAIQRMGHLHAREQAGSD